MASTTRSSSSRRCKCSPPTSVRAPPARPPACHLIAAPARASAACQWRVIKKLSYQHQKEMKKLMRNVGLKCPLKKYEEMFDDEFREKVRSASALSVCRCIARALLLLTGAERSAERCQTGGDRQAGGTLAGRAARNEGERGGGDGGVRPGGEVRRQHSGASFLPASAAASAASV